MKLSRSRAAFVLTLVVVMYGCGRPPSSRYYVLEPRGGAGGTSNPSQSQEGLVIGVETFQVDPPYDQDRIVYRVGEESPEIGFYAYHRWAAPLSRMLPRVVAAALDGTAGVKSIEPVVPGRDYPAYLEGHVLAFEEIDTPEGQRVRVRLTLSLLLADGTELWSDSIAGETTTRTAQVRDLVEHLSDLLGQALDRSRIGLERALKQEND